MLKIEEIKESIQKYWTKTDETSFPAKFIDNFFYHSKTNIIKCSSLANQLLRQGKKYKILAIENPSK